MKKTEKKIEDEKEKKLVGTLKEKIAKSQRDSEDKVVNKEKKIVSTSKQKDTLKSNRNSIINKTNRLNELAREQICEDKNCHIHGNLKVRGKIFKGHVIKKFHKRIVIEFEGMTYIRKYERYSKSRTKIHARLPCCMENDINIGDHVKVQECRPLSKIIHFVVIGKINKDKVGEEK